MGTCRGLILTGCSLRNSIAVAGRAMASKNELRSDASLAVLLSCVFVNIPFAIATVIDCLSVGFWHNFVAFAFSQAPVFQTLLGFAAIALDLIRGVIGNPRQRRYNGTGVDLAIFGTLWIICIHPGV
jgi:hypothetical protein